MLGQSVWLPRLTIALYEFSDRRQHFFLVSDKAGITTVIHHKPITRTINEQNIRFPLQHGKTAAAVFVEEIN